MGVGLLVTAWIARYLGPDQYGLWNYAIAFTALFSAFSTLGLDSIVVRELVKYPEKTNELLGTAFVLRLLGGLIAFSLSIITSILIGIRDFLTLSLIALSAGGFIFQAFLTIDYFYQAHIMSRYTVWAQNISFLIMSTVKIFLIFAHAPLLAFAVAGFIEIILGSAFLVGFYIYQTSKNISPLTSHVSLSHTPSLSPITNWRFSFPIAKLLLKDSWPLILSGIAIMIYMRIDQVMLKMMLDDRAVGLYSAAVKLSEIWYFIPMIISQSVFPSILNTKKVSEELYMKRIYNLYSLMIWLAIGIAIALTFFSVDVVKILFGSEYLPDSAKVLSLYVWAGIPVFLGVASSQYLIAENYTKLSFARTIVGAIANVILNLILIPYYGIIGAAIATLISYFIATFFIGLLPDEKLRKQVVMMLSGLLPRKVR
jgi:PST family polysaccharide transporter